MRALELVKELQDAGGEDRVYLGASVWRYCSTATPLLERGSGLARVADAVKSAPR